MRFPKGVMRGILVALVLAGCGSPTGDLGDEIDREAASVDGNWTGFLGGNSATLAFNLKESSTGALTGSGTMKEATAPSSVPITVTGTFRRPHLTLTFTGLVFEGANVQGTIQGEYGGIGFGGNIRLTGTNYDKTVQIFLIEE